MLSRWTDNTRSNINDLIDKMMDYKTWHKVEKDPYNNQELAFHINAIFEENQSVSLNGNDISFNLLRYSYERVRPGAEQEEMRSSRIYPISGLVLVYSDGYNTQYITDRSGNPATLTILRKLNNYQSQLEIEMAPFNITEDLFTWMINRVLNKSSDSLEEESSLLLNKIIGFKGSTKDRLAEIAGTGNRVLNQLSTLAFLFENEEVSYIKSKIEYENDEIEFSIDLKGNVDIDFETYVGEYLCEHFESTKTKVILKTFLEVIPKIISSYHLDLENKEWSEDIKVEFFTDIGKSISKHIENRMEDI